MCPGICNSTGGGQCRTCSRSARLGHAISLRRVKHQSDARTCDGSLPLDHMLQHSTVCAPCGPMQPSSRHRAQRGCNHTLTGTWVDS